jgi:uncharacterized protein YfaP (DUF2135 family)
MKRTLSILFLAFAMTACGESSTQSSDLQGTGNGDQQQQQDDQGQPSSSSHVLRIDLTWDASAVVVGDQNGADYDLELTLPGGKIVSKGSPDQGSCALVATSGHVVAGHERIDCSAPSPGTYVARLVWRSGFGSSVLKAMEVTNGTEATPFLIHTGGIIGGFREDSFAITE